MTDTTKLKAEHSDITRRLEADAREEQRIRAELQEKQARLQQQANSDSQMAEGLLRPILKRREDDIRRKTEIEGVLKWLEQTDAEKEAARAALAGARTKEDSP